MQGHPGVPPGFFRVQVRTDWQMSWIFGEDFWTPCPRNSSKNPRQNPHWNPRTKTPLNKNRHNKKIHTQKIRTQTKKTNKNPHGVATLRAAFLITYPNSIINYDHGQVLDTGTVGNWNAPSFDCNHALDLHWCTTASSAGKVYTERGKNAIFSCLWRKNLLSRSRSFWKGGNFRQVLGSFAAWNVGAAALHKFGADFFLFFFFFFSGFYLPENGMFKPVFCAAFWCADFCADFCAHFCADFRCADFCADFCAEFWCTDFCADFRSDFPQIFLRRFGALKIGVPESRKNAQKICGKICGVSMALQGRGFPIPSLLLEQTARDTIAARPTYSRRACEHPPWHLWAERHAWICSKIFQK